MAQIPVSIAVSPSGTTLLAAQQVTNTASTVVFNEVVTLGDAGSGNVGSLLASGAQLVEPGGVNAQPVTGTITANQATAANLNVTVVGTVTATLPTGSNTIGKVDILGNAAATLDSTIGAATAPTNALCVSGVYSSTISALTTGQAQALAEDTGGNLKTILGQSLQTLTAWTPANWTGGFTALLTPVNTGGAPAVIVQLDQNASITAGAVTWQGSYDGTNFVTIPASQFLDPTSNTLAATPNPYTFSVSSALNKPFLIVMGGYQQVRALESTPMTGAGASITPYVTQLGYQLNALPSRILGSGGTTLDASISAAAAPANGVAVLAQFLTTAPNPVTAQTSILQADYQGSLFVKPYRRKQTVAQATTIAATTSATTVLAAQAAGIFADIATLIITPTPGATSNTAFTCTLSDGTANYIFDVFTGSVATVTDAPVGVQINFDPPLPETTAATAWTIANSSATPTVHVTIVAVLQKAS